MTDLQLLFAILALLYLWECACWLRRGSVAFRAWLGPRSSLGHPGTLLGNARGGFVFAHPLPPLGRFFTAAQWPISLASSGLLLFVSTSVNPAGRPAQSGRFLPWSQLRHARASGKKLTINGQPWLTLSSEPLAHALAAQLLDLAKAPDDDRELRIQKLARKSLDSSAVEDHLAIFDRQSRSIKILANTLWLYLFALAPLAIWRWGLSTVWPLLLAGLLACTASLAFLFRRLHRQLFPAAGDERFTHFLIVLLSPVTAIRTQDLLSRPLLELFHPAAVARVLCSPNHFQLYARFLWRELHYPARPLLPTTTDPAALQTELFWRTTMISEMERFLKKSGLQPAQFLAPPPAIDPGCAAYCPRCLAQYSSLQQLCDDCGGLPLLPLAQPVAAHP